MTLASTLITDIRQQLGDTEDEHYSDAELLDLINRGMTDFSKMTFCLQASDSLTAASASSFAFTGLTYSPVVVFNVKYGSTPLYQASPVEARRWSPSAGAPMGWYEWNESINIDAAPSSGTLTIEYTRLPALLTATTDTLDFPAEWEDAIVDFVVAACRDKDTDGGLSDRSKSDYIAKKTEAHQIYSARLGINA